MPIDSLIVPVVMAGGTGSRLWPYSRQQYPKQFLPLTDPERSMLVCTLDRLAGLSPSKVAFPLVVCNSVHRFIAAEQVQLSALPHTRILLEPVGRGTAAVVSFACFHALSRGDDPVVLVAPSDHHISDDPAFVAAVSRAVAMAELNFLVTFGVKPSHAETGFGYIEAGEAVSELGMTVHSFNEKPSLECATDFLLSGKHFWNSGMLMFKASVMLGALEKWAPAVLQSCQFAWDRVQRDLDFLRLPEEPLADCPNMSIDCAVMEKAGNVAMVPLDAKWSDVGAWSALKDLWPGDEYGNRIRGDVLALHSSNCLIQSDSRLVTLLGVDDLVIVDTPDALLITKSDRAQEVKDLVNLLGAEKRSEVNMHRQVFRPWGSYEAIGHGNRYQVKRIVVEPGQALSLQLHHHRAEHWIVVRGTAQVVKGGEQFLITENQSTYIQIGELHSLENPGVIPLEMIEVQSGAYLGEDDIVRFSDKYGRVAT